MVLLVTGGMGYIGSHTVVQLLENGHEVWILDDLSNASADVLDRIAEITGKRPKFYVGDIRDDALLESIFSEGAIDAVLHFAGRKAVGESCSQPLLYYDNNLGGTLTLLKAMERHNCRQMIFSSSATVYGDAKEVPMREDFPLSATNPYGYTKLMIEQVLKDLAAADERWNITMLRYFNPIGAHESGLLGEKPNGVPNNLLPYIVDVACGRQKALRVFGNDYPTRDGTGVRDFIHVCDLAHGHVLALAHLDGLRIYNLGTGTGYSVLEIIRAFEQATGIPIPYTVEARRPGDIAESYADPRKAEQELGFKATRTLEDMCRSAYRFAVQSGRMEEP